MNPQPNRRQISHGLSAISLSLVLSACGGGGDQAPVSAISSPPLNTEPAQKPLACDVTTPPATLPAFGGKSTVAACGNLFVDPAVASTQYATIADAYHAALALDKAVYGSLQAAEPDVVVCGSTACADYFAGPSQRNVTLAAGTFVQAGGYVAPWITIVLTSATWDRNSYVLAHERSHVEVAARLNGKHVPAWFDEGLATYVGGEPQCSGVTGKGIADLTQLDTESDWTAYTADSSKFSTTYCQARAEVAAWISKKGTGAVGLLLQSVAQGAAFTMTYGAMLTQ